MQRVWIVVLAAIASATVPDLSADPTKLDDSAKIVSHIPRQPVRSTAIAAVGYSKRRHILEIEFVNGAIYRYLDVPPSVPGEIAQASHPAPRSIYSTLRSLVSLKIESSLNLSIPQSHEARHTGSVLGDLSSARETQYLQGTPGSQ